MYTRCPDAVVQYILRHFDLVFQQLERWGLQSQALRYMFLIEACRVASKVANARPATYLT
jgi:hypothetical protein